MADVTGADFSLMSLEEELTCSICLSTFDCPVTIPCGHNFCQDCLLATWKDSYSCPQCRTLFPTKPDLKKNTVLSIVVNTYKSGSSKSEACVDIDKNKPEKADVIRCDTCMEAEASQTCLTCMASFCEEHLRPHRENPVFRLHQLSEPLGDLQERICPDHNKLMELFCTQHSRPICSLCLQQVHKGCPFKTPEEQRNLQESDFRDKLGLLDGKIERTETVLLQMNDQQSKLMDAATNRKTALAAVYQQMRNMLVTEERKAQHEVDCELEIARTKLHDLTKRFTGNADAMRRARDEINHLMSQSQTLAFLQASHDLPRTVKFDPHPPRINLDSKKVMATQAFSAALKDYLTETFKQPVETRQLILPPDEKEDPVHGVAESTGTGTHPDSDHPKSQSQPRSPGPVCPPVQQIFQPVPVPIYINQHTNWNQSQFAPGFQRRPPPTAGQKTKQDRKPPSTVGGQTPGAAGEQKHGGKGFDSSKKHSPGGEPSSGKPATPNPKSKKKS